MKLEGSLDTFPLRELIEMVVYSSVTGALDIVGPGDPGRLYFRDSVLYHAEHGETRGLDALASLFELTTARFAFVSTVQTGEATLWGSLSLNLQSAERLARRWRQVRAYIPNHNLVPQLIGTHEAAIRRVGPAHYPVLDALDGQRSIRRLAEDLCWAEIDLAEALVQMTVDGLVELRMPRAVEAPVSHQPEQPGPTPGDGIFDRVRARYPRRVAEPHPPRSPEPRTSEELILQLLRG